jgi:catechol 2,3-dioxygenase-like lactoylglutathione lyase family enzyme
MDIKLQTIGIIAKDMAKTMSFYRTLGLPIPEQADGEFNYDFTTQNGLILGFLAEAAAKQADPNFKTPVGQSINLQFMVNSPDKVDEIHASLIKAGYTSYAEPWDAFWGQRFARVTDPDGRVVNIYAHL